MRITHKPPVKFLPGNVYIHLDKSHLSVPCIGVCVAPEVLLILTGMNPGTIQKPNWKWSWHYESWRTLEF